MPLISPPTPPQLEQDKAHIDESFNKAFALIDQLTTDTAEIKASEVERTEKLDTMVQEVNNVVSDLKAANARREAESRIIAEQVAGLKDQLPKSLKQWKKNGDDRLEDLATELQGLKKLLENRVGKTVPSTGINGSRTAPTDSGPGSAMTSDVSPSVDTGSVAGKAAPAPAPGVTIPKREGSPPKRAGGGRATIPAWQMAAASKSTASNAATNGDHDVAESSA